MTNKSSSSFSLISSGKSTVYFTLTVLTGLTFVVPAQLLADDEAKTAFEEGIAAFHEEDYPQALEAFQTSFDLRPLPKVLFNIAMCQKAMYRFADALETFERFIETSDLTEADSLYQDVLFERSEILAKIGRLEIASKPSGATVQVDGKAVGQTPLIPPHRVDPGEHTIIVEKSGFSTYRRTVNVTGGTTLDLTVVLDAETGTLDIRCPLQAELVLDDERQYACPFVGKIPAGPHKLSLYTPGAPSQDRTFELRADERLLLDLSTIQPSRNTLEIDPKQPTRQRPKGSRALFATGTVSLTLAASAGALGTFFVIQGNRTYEDGLTAIENGDRARYDDIKGNSLPAYKLGTVVSFVSTGVLFATGLTLTFMSRRMRAESKRPADVGLTANGIRVRF